MQARGPATAKALSPNAEQDMLAHK